MGFRFLEYNLNTQTQTLRAHLKRAGFPLPHTLEQLSLLEKENWGLVGLLDVSVLGVAFCPSGPQHTMSDLVRPWPSEL